MTSSRHIAVNEESQVGITRRYVIEICQRSGRDEMFCGKAAIVATEMARNLVRHGKGGEIVIRELCQSPPAGSEIARSRSRSGDSQYRGVPSRRLLHRRHSRHRFWLN